MKSRDVIEKLIAFGYLIPTGDREGRDSCGRISPPRQNDLSYCLLSM